MNRLLILASLLIAAISCSKESAETQQTETQQTDQTTATVVTFTASLTDAVTRVSTTSTSDEGWTFKWDEQDTISGWYTDCSTVDNFNTETYDEQASTFTGTVVDDKSYRFIYPYEDATITTEGYYTIDVSNQTGLDKTYLINDTPISSSSLVDGTLSNLTMKHLGGFMVVDVYMENFVEGKTYTLTKVSYSSAEGIIPVSAQIDMTLGVDAETGFYNNFEYGTLTATMSETFEAVAGSSQYLGAITNLNILPFTVASDQSATIELTIEVSAADGTVEHTLTSSVTIQNNSGADLPFARATHNYTYLTVDGSYGVQITGATINGWGTVVEGGDLATSQMIYTTASEISSSNVPFADTWVITDEGAITSDLMSGVRSALSSTYSAGREISIIMPNATSIGDDVFRDCHGLASIELPMATSIGIAAFMNCYSLTSIELPEATEVLNQAFHYCDHLTYIELPKVTTIGGEAFACCFALTTLKLTTESDINCGYGILIDTNNATNITLYIRKINSYATNLTNGTYTFKEIIYID